MGPQEEIKTINNITEQEARKLALCLGYTHAKTSSDNTQMRFRHLNDNKKGLVYRVGEGNLKTFQAIFTFDSEGTHKTYSRITLEQEE
jgi:hypothetical protein